MLKHHGSWAKLPYLSGGAVERLLGRAELRADELLLTQFLPGLTQVPTSLLQPETPTEQFTSHQFYPVYSPQPVCVCVCVASSLAQQQPPPLTSAASCPGLWHTALAWFYCPQTARTPAEEAGCEDRWFRWRQRWKPWWRHGVQHYGCRGFEWNVKYKCFSLPSEPMWAEVTDRISAVAPSRTCSTLMTTLIIVSGACDGISHRFNFFRLIRNE